MNAIIHNDEYVQREIEARNIRRANDGCTKNKHVQNLTNNNTISNKNNNYNNNNNTGSDNIGNNKECSYSINVEPWKGEDISNEHPCIHEMEKNLREHKSCYKEIYTLVNTCDLKESKKNRFSSTTNTNTNTDLNTNRNTNPNINRNNNPNTNPDTTIQYTKNESEREKEKEKEKEAKQKTYNGERKRKNIKRILTCSIYITKQTNKINHIKTEKLSHQWNKKKKRAHRNKRKRILNNLKCNNSHLCPPPKRCRRYHFIYEINKQNYTRRPRNQIYKWKRYQTDKIWEEKWHRNKFGYYNNWRQPSYFDGNDTVPYYTKNKKTYSPRKQKYNILHKKKSTNLKNCPVSGNVKFAEKVEHIHTNKKTEISMSNKKGILKQKKEIKEGKGEREVEREGEREREGEGEGKNIKDNSKMIIPHERKYFEKCSNISTRIVNESSFINDIQHGIGGYLTHVNKHNVDNESLYNSNNSNHNFMNINNTVIINNNTRHNHNHIQNSVNHMNNIINGLNEDVTDTFDLDESLFSDLDAYIDVFVRTGSVSSTSDTFDDLQAIHKATKAGNITLVKTLLEIGVNVNSKTKQRQFTPLHLAAAKGDLKCLELLIESNADVNAMSSDYETPLWCASITNHLEICKYLLQKGALVNINTHTQFYDSALHAASMMGHFEIVKLLVEHGANTKCLDSNLLEPLHYASFEGHKGIVKYLIWHQTKEALNKKMEEIVTNMKKYDIYNKKLETYYYLKYKSVFKKKITGKILCCAITSGNNKIVNIILRRGADPNYFDVRLQLFPVHAASITGNIKIFKDLVNKGANIFTKTSCNNSPIDLTEDQDIKNFILERSRKINIRNAWLIRIKSKSHILSLLSFDMFYRVCTFF